MMDLWLFSGMKLRTKFDTIFVQNQMNGSKYEWKIKDNTLLVKLKSDTVINSV